MRREVIRIYSSYCFNCGYLLKDKGTKHHAVPKSMRPKFNVIIPLCVECHKKLNSLFIYNGNK